MIPESVQREVQDFAAYFFREVTGRIPLQRAYHLPDITYNRSRSPEEEREMQNLEKRLRSYRADETVDKLVDGEPSPDTDHSERKNAQERYEELGSFLPVDELGHCNSGEKIILNSIPFQVGVPYQTIAHELLHAVREQTTPAALYLRSKLSGQLADWMDNFMESKPLRKDDNKPTLLEVNTTEDIGEFFGSLSNVVITSLGGVTHKGEPIAPDQEHTDVTLENLKRSAGCLGDVAGRVHSFFDCLRARDESVLRKAVHFLQQLYEPQHGTYLRLMHFQPEVLVNLATTIGEIFEKIIHSKCDVEKVITEGEDSFQQSLNYAKSKNKSVYARANLIINENCERLLQEWPEAFTLSQDDLIARYFVPVQKKFDELVLRSG